MEQKKLISIVIPVFNEDKGLEVLYRRLESAVSQSAYDFEIIFVNDGSGDDSLEVLITLHEKDPRIKIVDLSRNFGHQNALTAGIDHTTGEAVILMDADLEDRPECIALFIDYWNKGYDVVYAKREKRKVTGFRKICFNVFHKTNRIVSYIPVGAEGIFCLMDRKIVQHMQKFTEHDKYIPGLRSWVGFKQVGIEIERDARYDTRPRVKFGSLFKLAFDSFTSFSTLPLKLSMFLGITFSLLSFLGITTIIILKVFLKVPFRVQGWASTVVIIMLLGSIQLICIWLQGEYLMRILNEVKNRPHYIVNDKIGFDE